jgi:hypothetical protein
MSMHRKLVVKAFLAGEHDPELHNQKGELLEAVKIFTRCV